MSHPLRDRCLHVERSTTGIQGADMTIESRIPPKDVGGAYGALVKLISRKMFGRVPDSIGVLWNQPAVMKDAMGIGRKVEGWHELAPDLASYAAMASAAAVGCSFCLDL